MRFRNAKSNEPKMERQEYKDEYAKKSSFEGLFEYSMNNSKYKKIVIGMVKTEERMNLGSLSYNLLKLHNIKQEIKNTTEDLEDFCESTFIKTN